MADEVKCTCGRSITGNCLGWHDLTDEEYQRVREDAEIKARAERNPPPPTE